MVGTSSDTHYLLDAFTLVILRRLTGHQGLGLRDVNNRQAHSGEEVSWSSDSKWIASGSADGGIFLWEIAPPPGHAKIEPARVPDNLRYSQPAETLQPSVRLSASRAASRAVKLNPRFFVLAVGGEELVCTQSQINHTGADTACVVQSFWLPSKEGDAAVQEGW